MDIIKERFPDYMKDVRNYLDGSQAYFCNMFVFDRDTFFEYCQWFFSITFELERRRDMTGKRLFVSEWLTGIFITSLIRKGKKGAFFPTMIAEGKHEIPIVMGADNHYIFPLLISLGSAFRTAGDNTIYVAHLLLSHDFSTENIERIHILGEMYPKHKIHIHRMGEGYDFLDMRIKHITSATYYRLELPSLLPDVKKCIYIDSDTLVRRDLSEMFRINVDDKLIAGVRAAGYYWPYKWVRRTIALLGIPDLSQYVNAGVLIMNLANMRKWEVENAFRRLVPLGYQSQDQDIFNKVCYGKIRIIPPVWNAMTKYHLLDDSAYAQNIALELAYSLKEWEQARKFPAIIHYADQRKPWHDIDSDYAGLWWEEARQLPFYSDIIREYITNEGKKNELLSCSQSSAKAYEQLIAQNKDLARQRDRVRYDFNAMQHSFSFRIGRKITWGPRKVRGGYRCWKQHGTIYTFKRTIEHLGIDMGTGDFRK